MARSNVARRHGDEFQARLFWLHAVSLLDPDSPIIKVAYESGPKAFDDILIEYDPKAAPPDHEGQPIYRRHIQCKWHESGGAFGYADLIDPAFINASQHSILMRALHAQLSHAPEGTGCRFELKTNWRIRPDDPLLPLIGKSSDAIDVERLFAGKTDRSTMGQVRRLWREHLGIDDTALALVARVLAIAESGESLDHLRERLDERFHAVGLKRIPAAQSAFSYDDLIAKLLSQGRNEFDKDSFAAMALQERILDEQARSEQVPTIGIRSFMHPIDNLEDRCRTMLDLVPLFDRRYIRHEADWQERLFPKLRDFVLNAARQTDRLRLVADTHVSLAFALGTLLNVKSGKHVEIEQRTAGRRFWSINDTPAAADWPPFIFEDEILDEGRPEIALAIGLTHDVSHAVRTFVSKELHKTGRIIHCSPDSGPSQQSVRCGHHAWILTEALMRHFLALRSHGISATATHLFLAGPNGFAFFLGQHQQAMGPTTVYEWDLDGQRGGGYRVRVKTRHLFYWQ